MRNTIKGAIASICLTAVPAFSAHGAENTVALAAHRAVYEMMLDESADNKSVEALNGKLVYEQTGNVCEGFTLRARQVLNLQTEGGQITLDSTTNTYESGDGKTIRFKIDSRMNGNSQEETDGEAIIADDKELQIRLTKPETKRTTWKGEVILPTALTEKIIRTALAGDRTLSMSTYDGTDGGEAVFDTFTLIGKRIEPGAGGGLEEAAKTPELAKLARWPVKTSYFKRDGSSGERMPEYSVFSELYENGISRAVRLNFSEFTVKASLKELKLLPVGECLK